MVLICEQQKSFMPAASTAEAVFALTDRCLLTEKNREEELYQAFEKLYNRVQREEIWHCIYNPNSQSIMINIDKVLLVLTNKL